MPLLDAAAQALDNIQKEHMIQLKSFVKPPPSAAIVMEGICYAFNEDQHVSWVSVDPNLIEKVPDFWAYAKRKLLNDRLLQRVKTFKEEAIKNIPPKKVEKLKNFMKNPLFEEEKVKNASFAAYNLSLWLRAVVDTYDALAIVEPKKLSLATADAALLSAEQKLTDKKDALDQISELLRQLTDEYSEIRRQKEELENKVNRCKL